MCRHYYMVRAMRSEKEDFDIFFNNNVVAVGWSDVNFAEYTGNIDLLLQTVKDTCYNYTVAAQVLGKKLNEIRRFMNIKKNDIIVIPYYNCIRFAICSGVVKYSKDAVKYDLANQLDVRYLTEGNSIITLPRYELPEAFQRRLRVRGSTVTDLSEFSDEIENIINKKNYSYNAESAQKEEDYIRVFKKKSSQ